MNKASIIILVVVPLFIGYGLGKRSSGDSASSYPAHVEPSYSYAPLSGSGDAGSSESEQQLKSKLEDARQSMESARINAEMVRDSAEDAEHHARMRWLETGSLEDQMRMHDAGDAASHASDAVSNVESAISNAQ